MEDGKTTSIQEGKQSQAFQQFHSQPSSSAQLTVRISSVWISNEPNAWRSRSKQSSTTFKRYLKSILPLIFKRLFPSFPLSPLSFFLPLFPSFLPLSDRSLWILVCCHYLLMEPRSLPLFVLVNDRDCRKETR